MPILALAKTCKLRQHLFISSIYLSHLSAFQPLPILQLSNKFQERKKGELCFPFIILSPYSNMNTGLLVQAPLSLVFLSQSLHNCELIISGLRPLLELEALFTLMGCLLKKEEIMSHFVNEILDLLVSPHFLQAWF